MISGIGIIAGAALAYIGSSHILPCSVFVAKYDGRRETLIWNSQDNLIQFPKENIFW